MVDTFMQKKTKLEFRDIVLQHLKKILEISCSEFRGGYIKKVIVGNLVVDEYVPDTRKQYIQAVETLSDVLLPHFDKKMKDEYGKIMGVINRGVTAMNKKDQDKLTNKDIRDYTTKKLKQCRKLFQEINLLLKRSDYLKGSVYGESDFDNLDDDDDD